MGLVILVLARVSPVESAPIGISHCRGGLRDLRSRQPSRSCSADECFVLQRRLGIECQRNLTNSILRNLRGRAAYRTYDAAGQRMIIYGGLQSDGTVASDVDAQSH